MNIGNKNRASKWAVLAASSFLVAGVVAGCGNKGESTNSTAPSSTQTSTSATEFNGSDTVATVNGDNITRGDMYPLMVAQSGESVLAGLINNQLVMQQLKKDNLSVSDEEVTAFIDRRKAQGGPQSAQIEAAQKAGGAILTAVQQQARLQLAIEKLVTKDVKADPAAVKAWFAKNQAHYSTPARVKVGLLLAGTKVRADTLASQLKSKTKTFQQLVDEQKASSDPLGKQSTTESPEVPVDGLAKTLGPIMAPAAQKLPVGGTSAVLPVQKNVFAILSVISKSGGEKPDFAKQQSAIEGDYKLAQVAMGEIAKNGNKQPFDTVIKQIETAAEQQGAQTGNFTKPAFHDLLGYLTQGKIQEIQTKLRDGLQLTVSDTDLKEVAKKFAPNPTPASSSSAPSNNAPAPSAPAPTAPAKP